jgi:tetratricopeptide (TPR) repeat protein
MSQFGRLEGNKRFVEELARAKAADPSNPLLLALAKDKRDVKLAVVNHPEDWRSWLLWFDTNDSDIAAIRKAAQLAPTNGSVLSRLALAEQADGHEEEALKIAQRAAAIVPTAFVLHSLATVYERSGRCSDAIRELERAIEALPDHVDPRVPALYRERLRRMVATCGKHGSTANAKRVEVDPILKTCRQPLLSSDAETARWISVQFTIRDDGSVTAVAIQGTDDARKAGVLRQFVESCSFEPVIVDGRPRRVQVNLGLDALLQPR